MNAGQLAARRRSATIFITASQPGRTFGCKRSRPVVQLCGLPSGRRIQSAPDQSFIPANRRTRFTRFFTGSTVAFPRSCEADMECGRQTARARRFSSGSSKARCPEPAGLKTTEGCLWTKAARQAGAGSRQSRKSGASDLSQWQTDAQLPPSPMGVAS